MDLNEIKIKLKSKSVGIAGCGGLGSNCAIALARVGVGRLIVVDFDIIEQSNLNRQYYFFSQIGRKKCFALKENIEKINSNVDVIAVDKRIDRKSVIELFKNCDIIVEAFDIAEMKQMLIETVLYEMPGKPIVSGLGIAGFGENNIIRTEKIGNLYICGDRQKEISDDLPPLAPRVGIVANMQANQVLEILLSDSK